MPFVSSCCCSRHDEWKHGAVDSNNLRQCTREEAEILDFSSNDPKTKIAREKFAFLAAHDCKWKRSVVNLR